MYLDGIFGLTFNSYNFFSFKKSPTKSLITYPMPKLIIVKSLNPIFQIVMGITFRVNYPPEEIGGNDE